MPKQISIRRGAAVIAATAIVGAIFAFAPADRAEAAPSDFDGVNWADPRDNFTNDALVLSGIGAGDSYTAVRDKARAITREFNNKLGANTVRIPVNPATVNSSRWSSYRGVIDGIRAEGDRVIVAYWEGTNRDGRVDDTAAWNTMWNTVRSAYGSDSGVYFEPMNEPHGYSQSDWGNVAAGWLNQHNSVPRDRVIIDGHGYSEDVRAMCADSRLNGTLLSLHTYAFWRNQTYNQWVSDIRSKIGSCASRTVITEYGATMNSGLNYNAPSSINEVVFIQAVSDVARDLRLGAVYWPGLRSGDSYSITQLSGSGSNLTLNVQNQSARDRLRHAWDF